MVRVDVVKDVTARRLLEMTLRMVRRGSIIYTDKFHSYDALMCCGFGTGLVCREFCCDDWSCQRCDWATGSCQPSLQKAVDYGHLLLCQGCIVPDPNHTPSTNGCGPDGWKGQIVPDNPGGFPFETCCDSHDICYGTCHSAQAGCDFAFHTCMTGLCSGYPFPLYDLCIAFATAYYEAVHNFGYEHWSEGQTDACVCCGELLSY